MAAVWRRSSVESIACEDLAWVLFVVLRCLPLFELIFMGAMHAAAGVSKTMAFTGPTESCYPLAVSS